MRTAAAFLQDLAGCDYIPEVHWGPPLYIQDREDGQTLPNPPGCLLEVLWLMLDATKARQGTQQGQQRGYGGAA
jgi:hypothetical protein